MKSILVTGAAGFIGSNMVEYLIETYPDYKIVVIDALTYAGDLENLKSVKNAKNFTFVHGDICDRSLIQRIFQHYYIHDVIHLAAESHVDNSISNPDVFIETNVKGTFTLIINIGWTNHLFLKTDLKRVGFYMFQPMRFMEPWVKLVCLRKKPHMPQIRHTALQKQVVI